MLYLIKFKYIFKGQQYEKLYIISRKILNTHKKQIAVLLLIVLSIKCIFTDYI